MTVKLNEKIDNYVYTRYCSNSSCHSSSCIFAILAIFLGICTAISSSIANSVKFSAIFLLDEAELVPRASRRMGVEEQILPVLGKHSGIVF